MTTEVLKKVRTVLGGKRPQKSKKKSGLLGVWLVHDTCCALSDAGTRPERRGVLMAGGGNNADPLHSCRISVHFQDRVHRFLATQKTKEAHTTLLSCFC